MQWHALAFVLSELCVRTTGPDVEHAWRLVDTVMQHQSDEISKLGSHLWKPLKMLRAKAKHQREKALAEEIQLSPTAFAGSRNVGIPDDSDPLMSLDFGVDRLYPVLQDTPALPHFPSQDRSNSWPAQNMSVSPALPSLGPGMMAPSAFSGASTQSGLPVGSSNAVAGISSQPFSSLGLAKGFSPIESQDVSMLDPQSINWASWDDMVQEYNLQNEAVGRTNGDDPKAALYFGDGANWY
jgi:hypothetical protein